MNFREKFENWIRRTYKYTPEPIKPFTAMSVRYKDRLTQARWEAWQASSVDSIEIKQEK